MAYSLKAIAELLNGSIEGDEDITIKGVNSLELAEEGEISFYYDPRYKENLSKTKASAIIVSKPEPSFKGTQIIVKSPALAFARLMSLFSKDKRPEPYIHKMAVIDETANIGKDVTIYPFVFVGRDAIIGDESVLYPGVYIGDGARVGKKNILHPNVVILDKCITGEHVIIHAGTIVGSDGFGYVKDGRLNLKIPQRGIVRIDDNVEIGSNCSIDRATLGITWIKSGVKMDNLIQIGHNVIIGENTIIVAQTGISGSVNVGSDVIIGGQVGISDHVSIGNRVMIGSQSGVARSIPEGEVVSGTPTMPHRRWLKVSRLVERMPEFIERLRYLEKRLKEIEKGDKNETATTI